MTYKDQTYCASPQCENECGRKMSEETKEKLKDCDRILWAYFCGEPEQPVRTIPTKEELKSAVDKTMKKYGKALKILAER